MLNKLAKGIKLLFGVDDEIELLKAIKRTMFYRYTKGYPCFYFEKPVRFKVDGITYCLPVKDCSVASLDMFDKNNPIRKAIEERFLRAPYGTYIDIGANMGAFSIPIAKRFPNVKVVAVEPIPWLAKSIKDTAKLNGLNNIHVEECAISSTTVKEINIPCTEDVHHTQTASLLNRKDYKKLINKYVKVKKIKIKTKKLDSLLVDYKDISLIKIDVEGKELDVLKSGKKLLMKYKPMIIFEAWDVGRFTHTYNFLRKFKYKTKKIDRCNYIAY